MEWYEVLVGVLGAVGGVGGFVSLYKAKPTKVALEIDNLQKAISILSGEYKTYREQATGMITDLRSRIKLVEQRNKVMDMAIRSAFQCQHVQGNKDCPVLSNYERLCNNNEGVCELNMGQTRTNK